MGNASTRTLKNTDAQRGPMHVRALLAALVLVTAAFAGCADGGEEDSAAEPAGESELEQTNTSAANETDAEAEQPADEGPSLEWFNGSVRGQSAPGLGPVCLLDCDNRFAFNVSENTSALVAEMVWEAEASMMLDVDIPYEECDAVVAQDCRPGAVSGSEGHLRLESQDMVTGEWMASAWAEDSPTQPVDVTIVVSQFEDTPVPPGYSQLGPNA